MVRKYNIANRLKRHTKVIEVHYNNWYMTEGKSLCLGALRFFTVWHWLAPCGRIFKEILLGLTWGWPEVLPMAPLVLILNRWIRPKLFSVPLLHISLVKTNEWEEDYFWPIAVTNLCCDTKSEARAQIEGPQVEYICLKELKIISAMHW